MKQFSQVIPLQTELKEQRNKTHKIAFAPTMGALHLGHVSLIEIGKQYAEKSVCSIFVNPTQFNNKEDLAKYPRMYEQDVLLLEKVGCDFLFAPSVDEMYPHGLDTKVNIDLKGLDSVMEGEFRPGHFAGMLQVVKRLLDIVHPDFLIMGQKDFQQFSLVNHMINTLQLPVKLVMAPTLREADGLAMSSRNLRLSPEMRKKSNIIFAALSHIREHFSIQSPGKLATQAMERIEKMGLKPEYVEIVDQSNLQRVKTINAPNAVVCVAAWADDVRLIDNMILSD